MHIFRWNNSVVFYAIFSWLFAIPFRQKRNIQWGLSSFRKSFLANVELDLLFGDLNDASSWLLKPAIHFLEWRKRCRVTSAFATKDPINATRNRSAFTKGFHYAIPAQEGRPNKKSICSLLDSLTRFSTRTLFPPFQLTIFGKISFPI